MIARRKILGAEITLTNLSQIDLSFHVHRVGKRVAPKAYGLGRKRYGHQLIGLSRYSTWWSVYVDSGVSVASGSNRLGALELRLEMGPGESVYAGNWIVGEIVRERELSLDELGICN